MRVILIGAVESTKITLNVMINKNIKPLLITLPHYYSYRHSDFVDLREICKENNIEIVETPNINSKDTIDIIKKYNPDYLFVIGWSQIVNNEILIIPKRGSIGFHPAPLPKNRGRGVIPWTILQKSKITGTTLFWLDEGVDSGDIFIQKKFPVEPNETAKTLYKKHSEILLDLLYEAFKLIEENNTPRIPQDHSQATYCAKRTPEDGFINWYLPADEIWTLIRAVTEPYPGAFTFYNEKKLIIWEADYIGDSPYCGLPGQIQKISDSGIFVSCGDGKILLLKNMQLENNNERILQYGLFKLHDKLGINWIKFYQKYLCNINEK